MCNAACTLFDEGTMMMQQGDSDEIWEKYDFGFHLLMLSRVLSYNLQQLNVYSPDRDATDELLTSLVDKVDVIVNFSNPLQGQPPASTPKRDDAYG